MYESVRPARISQLDGHYPRGQLTTKGITQLKTLGVKLRERYVDDMKLFDPLRGHKHISVRSRYFQS